MFGPVLDVTIGLILVFLLVSLLCSGILEIFSSASSRRGKYLTAAIGKLIGPFAGDFFRHPLIKELSGNSGRPAKREQAGTTAAGPNANVTAEVCPRPPSYIPPRLFALTLVSVLGGEGPSERGQGPGEPLPRLLEDLLHPGVAGSKVAAVEKAIREIPDGDQREALKRSLLTLLADAGNFDSFLGKVGEWFDQAMDRVTGWYRRRTRFWLFVMGLVVAVVLNVDTVLLVRTLWSDGTLREAVVGVAEANASNLPPSPAVGDTATSTPTPSTPAVEQTLSPCPTTAIPTSGADTEATEEPDGAVFKVPVAGSPACAVAQIKELAELGIPLGWPAQWISKWWSEPELKDDPRIPQDWRGIWLKVLGIILTAAAVSMGAPFWFDLLNRAVNLRGAGKRPGSNGETTK